MIETAIALLAAKVKAASIAAHNSATMAGLMLDKDKEERKNDGTLTD